MAPHPEVTPAEPILSPMALRDMSVAKTLVKRADGYMQLASAGARPPTDLKGPGFQIMFALIGVGMTLTALWFFFWAKNGGFRWRGKQDWEDYKSTVLRRKGPDGKTLSNATKSTRLGGGSVVHGGSYGAESSIGYTDETGTSADANEYRDAEEGKGGLRGGDGRTHKKNRRDHTNDYKDPELREYRNEKAARVGGLNRAADGMYTDYSGSQPSELGSNVSSRPLVKKDKSDPKKEAKEKERRAKERMRNAKAAEKEAAKTAAAEAKARKEAEKAEAKRVKAEQKKMKKNRGPETVTSETPEMAEVTRPLTDYQTEYTRAYTEYTAPSEAGAPAPKSKSAPKRSPPSAAYSFTTGDDTNTVYSGAYTDKDDTRSQARTAPSELNESSYYSDYRPNADASLYSAKKESRSRSARPSQDRPSQDRSNRQSQSQTRPRGARPERSSSQSPRKQHRSSRAAPSDIFTATNGDTQGHMSYPCHIPGLSSAASVSVSPYDSVSQAGAPPPRRGRDVMDGYRRGGVRTVGRRDSLSDSDS